jgi:hypothetical protein
MDREELAEKVDDELPNYHDLETKKVRKRAINIRRSNSYILFDIERHPGAGDASAETPYVTLQTWRYDEKNDNLGLVCEFARRLVSKIEQNDIGEPVCRHCGKTLVHEEVHAYTWQCFDCGAIGGGEEELFDPSWWTTPWNKTDYTEKEDGLWIKKEE